MQNQKVIEQLGYTAKEAKVYLASLSLGEAHISDIADKVKMPLSSVQVIADKLHEDGLMNFYVMRRYKYWVAASPEYLLANQKQREENLKEALPFLNELRKAAKIPKKYDKNYQKSMEIFKVLADSLPQAVLIANSDSEIEYVNQTWSELFGYKNDEIHGNYPNILSSEKTDKTVYQNMWKKLNDEKLFQSEEITDKKKDGTLIKLVTTIFPVHHGNRKFFIQILDEITDKIAFNKILFLLLCVSC